METLGNGAEVIQVKGDFVLCKFRHDFVTWRKGSDGGMYSGHYFKDNLIGASKDLKLRHNNLTATEDNFNYLRFLMTVKVLELNCFDNIPPEVLYDDVTDLTQEFTDDWDLDSGRSSSDLITNFLKERLSHER